MKFLLDVNVLVGLIDPLNSRHEAAHLWFSEAAQHSWSTCPLTENGVMRVVGNSKFPNSPGNPGAVAEALSSLLRHPGHEFWPDDISLMDREKADASRLLTSGQVTDSYLLALAIAHGGQLATFDRRLITDAVLGGARGVHRIRG